MYLQKPYEVLNIKVNGHEMPLKPSEVNEHAIPHDISSKAWHVQWETKAKHNLNVLCKLWCPYSAKIEDEMKNLRAVVIWSGTSKDHGQMCEHIFNLTEVAVWNCMCELEDIQKILC